MIKNISGIQQIGIGVSDVNNAWKWYRKNFGMDIPIFQESAEAALMTRYTGGVVHSRSAVLAMNLQGGAGMEIWQFTSRKSEQQNFEIQLGDYGIFCSKIKCIDVRKTFEQFKKDGLNILGNINNSPDGTEHFFVKDPFGNTHQIIKADDWYTNGNRLTGGICGCVIGVSDIEKSLKLYSDVLEYDKIIYDKTSIFPDFAALPSGTKKMRRILLQRTKKQTGNFSDLLGAGSIELVQVSDIQPKKIFENRFWGDLGFIHLCFDVQEMNDLKKSCEAAGFPFTVDSSNAFDMGEASGHFSYVEDPDGTLIEFVEAYKIPIFKKIGWYLNLKKRNPLKPLPKWMLRALALNRVRD